MPDRIFKYRNFSKQEDRDLLLHCYLYFANPNSFPDKDDMRFYRIKDLDEYFEYIESNKKTWFKDFRKINPRATMTNFEQVIQRKKRMTKEELELWEDESFKSEFGVFCTSKKENSDMHWKEYSKDINDAFCIVYNGLILRNILSKMGYPYGNVVYKNDLRKFYLLDNTNPFERMAHTCFQKGLKYEWEDEFRMMVLNREIGGTRKLPVPSESIIEIQVHHQSRLGLEEDIRAILPKELEGLKVIRMPMVEIE